MGRIPLVFELVRRFLAMEQGVLQIFHPLSPYHGGLPPSPGYHQKKGCPRDIRHPARYFYFVDDILSLKDNPMIQRLSSVTLTFYNLVVLILLMGAGVIFSTAHKEIFTQMNEVNIFTWLTATWDRSPEAVVWFLLLCVCAGVLFINALCCSLGRQLTLAKKSGQMLIQQQMPKRSMRVSR